MNLGEVWFSLVKRPGPPPRSVHLTVRDLNSKIRASINGCNDRSRPFVWIETDDEPRLANRKQTSNSNH